MNTMDLAYIAEELKKKLPSDVRMYSSNNEYWDIYKDISGFIEDEYFCVNIRKHETGSPIIEIAGTTENPSKLIEIIKSIDEAAVITYYEYNDYSKVKTI